MADQKAELVSLLGPNNVLDDPATLDSYSGDRSFTRTVRPRFVVKSQNVDQVQKIVGWANRTNTPLVPVSSGPPHFHGDTVPSVSGAVVLDLTGMNKIIKVNRRNRQVIVEPGTTYSQLQPVLLEAGMSLSTSLLPRANKSILADLLERGPRTDCRFQWSSLEPLRSLEVVWGDGNKMWTGGAGHDVWDLEKQWSQQKWQLDPTGPGQADFYRFLSAAQGSMGIATWASLRCQVLPKVHKLFFVPAKELNDLYNFTYKILRLRYADELFILNRANLASIISGNAAKVKALKDQLPPWVVLVGIAGRDDLPEERVDFQEKDIAGFAREFGLDLMPTVAGAEGAQVLDIITQPSREPYWKLDYKGGCQDIFFITVLEKTHEFVTSMNEVAKTSGYPVSDIGVYIQPRHQGVNVHCEFNLPYDPANQQAVASMQELYLKASGELNNQGAFFTRPYGSWADFAFKKDPQSTNLLKKIKETFDPNGIMNPGKLCFAQKGEES
jgi:FAD/FMN-containing dehydrogenase